MSDSSYVGRCPSLKTLTASLTISTGVALRGPEVELEGPLVVEIERVNSPMI